MSAWARQRQGIVIFYFVVLALLAVTISYFVFIYKPPGCFDGVKNGLEEGVDCGGGCQLVCPFRAATPNNPWARAFEIAPGLYNFAAEVENPNFAVGAQVEYVFRAYNIDNIQIAEVFGSRPLYPTEKTIIFEPAVDTGERRVTRVFFDFIEPINWYKSPPIVNNIISKSYDLEDVTTKPKLQATLFNTGSKSVGNLIVSAVLYDESENITQVSQTYVDQINADSEAQAFFTWRIPFESVIQNVELFVSEPQN